MKALDKKMSGFQAKANKSFSLGGITKAFAAITAITASVAGLVKGMEKYAELRNSVQRVNELFQESSKYLKYFAENNSRAFGMAETTAYQYAMTYGNLFKGITKDTTENAKVTIAMMKTSAVVASKTGRTMEDVNERIRSGILGNTEAIEDLGINVPIAMIKTTKAFKDVAKGAKWENLTYQQQQQIRVLAILEQATNQYGNTVSQISGWSLPRLGQAFKDLVAYSGMFITAGLQPLINALGQLVVWATAGLKALAKLFGMKVEGNLAIPASNVGAGLATGAAGAEDMAGGLGTAAKNAKKLQRQLAGFDQFNDITATETGEGGGGGSGGGAGGSGSGTSPFDSIEMPEYGESLFDDGKFQKLKDALTPTIEAFQNLWKAMEPVKQFVAQGAIDFYNEFLEPVGGWVLGEGLPRLINAISKHFKSVDWSKINDGLKELWKALSPFAITVGEGLVWFAENYVMPMQTWVWNNAIPAGIEALTAMIKIATPILEGFGLVFDTVWTKLIKPIAEVVGKQLVKFWGELKETYQSVQQTIGNSTVFQDLKTILDLILPVISAIIGKLVELEFFKLTLTWQAAIKIATLLFKDAESAIGAVASIIRGDFKGAWGNLKNLLLDNKIEFVTGLFQTMKEKIGEVITSVGELVENWKEKLTEFVNTWVTKITDWWDNKVKPWFTVEKWNEVLFNIGVSLGQAVADFVTLWAVKIPEWWENDVKPWFTTEKWQGLFNTIKNSMSETITGFVSTWQTKIKNWWENDVQPWFTIEQWVKLGENMKNGIVDGFKGVVDGIKGAINGVLSGMKRMVNGVVKGINKIIEGYNSVAKSSPFLPILSTIKEIDIPPLAEGGFAYGKTLAMVGDNPRAYADPEVISPLSTLKGMIVEALMQKEIVTGGSSEMRITLQLANGEALADMLIDPMNKKAKNLGYAPVWKPV